MKNLNLHVRNNIEIDYLRKLEDAFNLILQESGHNLNRIVKDGDTSDTLCIPVDLDICKDLQKFLALFHGLLMAVEVENSFWSGFWFSLWTLDDITDNDKFVRWLEKYADSARSVE